MSTFFQGNFLVASKQLKDRNFYRSVVLMLDHNPQGAMGLIINRPAAMKVGEALSSHGQVMHPDAPVFAGGPVEPNSLFILHNSPILGKTDSEIAPGIFLTSSEASFDAVVRGTPGHDHAIRFRLISGYAGWGADQLEGEIARGDWQVIPGDGPLVLEEDPYGIWEVCTRRINRINRLLPHDVRNPEWN
ncbi:MAG: YqgE/AlgH family protein [Planctomycetota bacterium]